MKKIVVCILTLMLSVAGCGGQTAAPTPAPAAPAAATVAPAAQPTAAPAQVATKPAPATPAPAATQEDVLALQSRDAGLDKLKSYRARWQADWRSTEAGKAESGTWDFTEEYTAQPPALHVIWRSGGSDAPAAAAFEMWRIGDTTYIRSAEAGKTAECVAIASSDGENRLTRGMFNPNTLGSLQGARYVGAETVNGIKTKHYRYDEKATSLAGVGKVAGDIWVAVDGGFTVKDTVTWSGTAGFFGAPSKSVGDGKWTWELTEVNQPLNIKPPAECAVPAGDLPILPDAKEKSSMGTIVMYKSATKLEDAAAFYKKELAAAGWTLANESNLGSQLVQLSFEKDGKDAQVMLTADGGTTQVMINVEK